MEAIKIRIRNEQHSAAVQDALFELGYTWYDDDICLQHTGAKFLYGEVAGNVCYGNNLDNFLSCGAKEVSLEYLESIRDTESTLAVPKYAPSESRDFYKNRKLEILSEIWRSVSENREFPLLILEEFKWLCEKP